MITLASASKAEISRLALVCCMLVILFVLTSLLLIGGCATHSTNCQMAWQKVVEMDACMPNGGMWSAHELDPDGDKKYRKMYGPLLSFWSFPEEDTLPFLISRLGSTNETKVHVCPRNNATEGELAVYVLGGGTCAWVRALGLDTLPDNSQEAVRNALESDGERARMIEYFENANSHK